MRKFPQYVRPFFGIRQFWIGRIDVDGKGRLHFKQWDGIFERGQHMLVADAESYSYAAGYAMRILDSFRANRSFSANKLGIAPDRLAVLAPEQRKDPARRGFARIPLPLAVVQHAAGCKTLSEAAYYVVSEAAFCRSDRGAVPFGRVPVVDRDERGFGPHGQPHVFPEKVLVHLLAEGTERRPGFLGKRQRHPRPFGNTRHARLKREFHLGWLDRSSDRHRRTMVRRCRQRQMAFATEHAGGRIEPDPASAGQVNFSPRMQVDAILLDTFRTIERLHVGLELDEVA